LGCSCEWGRKEKMRRKIVKKNMMKDQNAVGEEEVRGRLKVIWCGRRRNRLKRTRIKTIGEKRI
jgi:hypothetical protein